VVQEFLVKVMPEVLDLLMATGLVQAGAVRVRLDCLHLMPLVETHFKMAVMVALDFAQPLQAQEFFTLVVAVAVQVG
jgi:hypothetical protein